MPGPVVIPHGWFYQDCYEGRIFAGGMVTTAINNATYTTGTLGATCTPILGVWNPVGSGKNLVLIRAVLVLTITAATNTGIGTLVWCTATAQNAISVGNTPLNCGSLSTTPASVAKDLTNVAPTGQSGNLSARWASSLGGGASSNFSFVGTAVGDVTVQNPSVENFYGDLIVPPGGELVLLATTTPVAHSAASKLVWAEVSV